jgi:hypothetical protein
MVLMNTRFSTPLSEQNEPHQVTKNYSVCLLTADEPTTLSDNPGSIILFSTLMMRAAVGDVRYF